MVHGLLNFKNKPVIGQELKEEIIQYALGDKTNLDPITTRINYTNNDLSKGTHTFDLVGTDWYLCLHNDTVNFIPKHNGVLNKIKDEGGTINIDNNYSTYAKINQKANLNFHGQVLPLNTKFKTNDSFTYMSKPLALEKEFSDPDVDYK